MMSEFAQSKFTKFIFYSVAISLAISLIATVSCDGPIDSIFGWRDKTSCVYKTYGCIIGSSVEENTAAGAGVLVLFLVLVGIVYGCIFFIKKLLKSNHTR